MGEKKSTTIEEQLAKLKERGMDFDDEQKAKENLLDIGYFRLGFYWFPFEQNYPRKTKRSHKFKKEAKFENAIQLYYFDFDLRNILLRYISRVEINFRTKLIYYVSNKYKDDPFWYVDDKILRQTFIKSEDYQRALRDVAKEDIVKHHKLIHKKHQFAPAWKAIEFMSFGTVITIYDHLIDGGLRLQIAKVCGVDSPSRLSNYMNTIRRLRNCCAHGKVLFDLSLPEAISVGGPVTLNSSSKTNLSGTYKVLEYLLSKVSANRAKDMNQAVTDAFQRIKSEDVRKIICNNSGLSFKQA